MACSKLRGAFTKRIVVSTNDPRKPQVTLVCKGEIRDAVKMKPTRLYFGKIAHGDPPATRKMELTRGEGGPLDLKLLPVDSDDFTVVLNEIEPGERYELIATLTPPFKSNSVRHNLTLETGIAEAPTALVLLSASVQARVTSWPAKFNVPRYRTKDWEESVRLRWFDKQPHGLIGAKVNDPKMTAEVQETNGYPEVVLKVPLDYRTGNRPRLVTVQTEDPLSPEVKIPVVFVNQTVQRNRAKPAWRRTNKGKKTPAPAATPGQRTKADAPKPQDGKNIPAKVGVTNTPTPEPATGAPPE